ncbi:MAG: peptidoglycan DD-metalloendopeptidase family protein, partial [Chloroflexi bacterium]|nr:peptidoglycan DD-metalloendopeptidase family protein [Chloroflexota bacterium]
PGVILVDDPPFSLPFASDPGPTTWLYEQHYGNTTSAFNYGNVWYEFGQGLHFGMDFEAPCGTPVLAIADGVVSYVDADGFGAGPHSLVIDHTGTGFVSLYGHLLSVPAFVRGDVVQRGAEIGLTGDPDGSCESRPHLHLEIRSADYLIAYNPLPFFEANWHTLASIGPVASNFQQDLDSPRRWMKLEDQPDILFSGNLLNNYQHPWPPRLEIRAPVNPPAYRHLDSLPDDVEITQTRVSMRLWNIGVWWNPADSEAVYLIDSVPDISAAVLRQPLDGSPREFVETAPPSLYSPDGSVRVQKNPGDDWMRITRVSDGASWEVDTGGNYPAVSPDGTRLLWEVVFGEIMPGTASPGVRAVVANLDGSDPRVVYSFSGGYALWLDSHRLLIVKRIDFTAESLLYVLDVDDREAEAVPLGTVENLHGLKVAPGGERLVYYAPFQSNPAASGVYVLLTEPGSTPHKLPFFGAYRWRDDRSLFVLSYDPDQAAHALGVVDVIEDDLRWLTDPDDLPIRVANGEWSVSPDGSRIVYVDPEDYGLYLLTVGAE